MKAGPIYFIRSLHRNVPWLGLPFSGPESRCADSFPTEPSVGIEALVGREIYDADLSPLRALPSWLVIELPVRETCIVYVTVIRE